MPAISDLEHELREIINSPRKQYSLLQDTAIWNTICSCLDVIGDIELCFSSYITMGRWPEISEGASYLMVYGSLQALFIQQDAIKHLAEALNISFSPNPKLQLIREIRNDSVGHPTKRGSGKGRAYNFISRITLGPYGFQLMTTFSDGSEPKFTHVDILSLIATQQEVVTGVLQTIIDELKRENMDHKNQFADKRLQDLFPKTLDYYFEKIFEGIYRHEYKSLSALNTSLIQNHIQQFVDALRDRNILGAYPGITHTLSLIEYPIMELTKYFNDHNESKLNDQDAYIFASFVKKEVDELLEMAKELDDEYSSESV
jgi:hypothetical protein